MKKILFALAGATLIGTGNPAVAGPDWQIIEHGRKVAAERWQQAQAQEHAKREQLSDQAAAENQEKKSCHDTNRKSD